MSKYKELKIELKNPVSLAQALQDLGVRFTAAAGLKANNIPLDNGWHKEDIRHVALAISREEMERVTGHAYNGAGFEWNGSGYTVHTDELDAGRPGSVAFWGRLNQRYGVLEATALARRQGYTVTEEQAADGTVRLLCRRR